MVATIAPGLLEVEVTIARGSSLERRRELSAQDPHYGYRLITALMWRGRFTLSESTVCFNLSITVSPPDAWRGEARAR